MRFPKRPGRRHARSRWLGLSGVAVLAAAAIAFATFQVGTRSASAAGPLLSQGKPVTASSVEGGAWPASAAVDGDGKTRWSSGFSDNQWIQVDLGAPSAIDQIVLHWEAAYATAYRIEVSPDAQQWTQVYATTTAKGGDETLDVSGSGRYVRLTGTKRSSQYGISLYEFQVYGPGAAAGSTPTAPAGGATPTTTQASSSPGTPATGATLISQSRPTIASTFESGGFAARGATDGDDTTRWSSQFLDDQWLRVDFGSTAQISKVVLHWENSYASGFELQTSDDGTAWKPIYTTTSGKGGNQTLDVTGAGRYIRLFATRRATNYGVSLWEFQVYGTIPGAPAPGGPGYILANPQVTGATPAAGNPAHALFHEFQANCSVTHDAPDDPIVYPGKPGASHMHTFLGSTITKASTTPEDLRSAPPAACKAPGDKSAYWMPTLYNGDKVVDPIGPQVIYYKTGIRDYPAVRPFPPGLRFVVGDPKATAEEFHDQPGFVEGFECGNSSWNIDIPATCPAGTELNIRFQAPSCWNGLYLDTPDHKSHMAYAVDGVCPKDHPVALPMLEFKMAFPVNGDMSQVHFSSGRGFSFHYDFMNGWDQPTLQALVTHCINGGLQCNARGYDETQPGKGAALNEQYLLP